MRSPVPYLRGLDPGLSRAVWTLQAGSFANAFWNGMVTAASLVVSAVGFGGYALVREPWHALLRWAVAGVGGGAPRPSASRLIAGFTEREARHSAYAMQRVANNLGIGWLVGAATCACGGLGALALERRIPYDLRRTPRRVALAEAA